MDIHLRPPWSYLILLIPVLVIFAVVIVTTGWQWEALLIPAFFVALLLWYLKAR